MSHRVDHFRNEMIEHLQERQWSQSDIDHFTHMVGHSALMSSQGALSILQFQQATDERIAAEVEHDRWAIAQEFLPEIERTDTAQLRNTIPEA